VYVILFEKQCFFFFQKGNELRLPGPALPFLKFFGLAVRQTTKPLVKVILRTTRRPHRENWRSVRLVKALYLSLGYASIRAQYLLESEEMPKVSDDTLMDTGVEVVLELVAYMVGGYFL